MSFLYPRTITITRPDTTLGVGALSYQGLNPQSETTIASNVPANIQHTENARQKDAGLEADINRKNMWAIFFNLPNGTVKDRDIITDDLNIRYQVSAAYWNSLGYKALCERLEV